MIWPISGIIRVSFFSFVFFMAVVVKDKWGSEEKRLNPKENVQKLKEMQWGWSRERWGKSSAF
jgi:hypothetical protein